jgi:small-conductance mechanosensitive channel
MGRLPLILSALALAISTASALATTLAVARRPPRLSAPAPVADLEGLEQQVALLTRQMEAVKVGLSMRAVAAAQGQAAAPTGAGSGQELPANLAALSALSARLAELEQQTQVARDRGILPLTPEAMAKATAAAVDRGAALRDRVMALRQLRPVNGREDGRTPEVALAMIELITAPQTPAEARADIIRNMKGVDHPALKEPLLAIVTKDTDSDTRREAVESLLPFYSDPQVHATINHLKDSEADPKVSREAVRRLAEWEARRR